MRHEESPDSADRLLGNATFLEPLDESVSEELLSALLESRAELCRYMPWDCWNGEAVSNFIERATHGRGEGTRFEFAIRKRDDGLLIGVIGLKDLEPFTPKGEVGYWVRSSMTGRGYATDALSALLECCRRELHLTRVDACAAESNLASQKVLLKCGFQREGAKRKGQLCHGHWLDIALFGKLLD